jgi:hypothetical protein
MWDNYVSEATMPSNVFHGLTSLNHIELHGNQFTTFHEDLFQGLPSLTVGLDLYKNNITSLPEGLFRNLTLLPWIRLGDNQLTTLPSGLLRGLTSLNRLFLDNNKLARLPDDCFQGLTSLQWLHIGGNQDLECLPASLPPGVNVIHENGNPLTLPPCPTQVGTNCSTTPICAFFCICTMKLLYMCVGVALPS